VGVCSLAGWLATSGVLGGGGGSRHDNQVGGYDVPQGQQAAGGGGRAWCTQAGRCVWCTQGQQADGGVCMVYSYMAGTATTYPRMSNYDFPCVWWGHRVFAGGAASTLNQLEDECTKSTRILTQVML
jgi:hypothetical protein